MDRIKDRDMCGDKCGDKCGDTNRDNPETRVRRGDGGCQAQGHDQDMRLDMYSTCPGTISRQGHRTDTDMSGHAGRTRTPASAAIRAE